MTTKRIVARNLGSNYVLQGGNLVLEPHPLLERVKQRYPTLRAQYEAIELSKSLSESTKKQRLHAIKTVWSRIWDANRTFAREHNLMFPCFTVPAGELLLPRRNGN